MPNEESKPVDPAAEEAEATKAVEELKLEDEGSSADKGKGKASKKEKIKSAISAISSSSGKNATPKTAEDNLPGELIDSLSAEQIANLLAGNPALRSSLPASAQAGDEKALKAALKNMNAAELMTGLSKGKNAKDMASHKFWSTQPVTQLKDAGAKAPKPEGPIKLIDKDKVPREPAPLVEGFEWCEVDLLKAEEIEEVRTLLAGHYVEDDEALFRFNYSLSTLKWALMAPHWKKSWHIGVRAVTSKRLVAFISAIPLTLKVKEKEINASEVNFMCVHKKLRSKRLAPVLIMEITRRCYVEGIYQAIYTGGNYLPTPIASCRYFHRALNWEKLYTVGFSPLPHGSTKTRQIAKYKLPERPSTAGLRMMEEKDVAGVGDLLRRYLKKMDVSQLFSDEEARHWLLDKEKDPKAKDRVVWTYVVEKDGKIVDVISYYCLESTILNSTTGNTVIRAAYLFYYATEAAFQDDVKVLSDQLNTLVKDALILAKQANFDVFNALTLLDNPLFLQKQLFGAGDGQLHYYLFNYSVTPVPAGVDDKNQVDDKKRRGVGVVML
ncbi:N-myristoyl transferase [Myriangium duriaei CBS 260.36]|uniref:Glycylpeptide N-tetradecanoyltransferase n=1 Tax=Myriangium duriaei CBS 260.36 TaxID=1168546 RepID=A0A9P4IRK4_9PEZI|nr:N-myristoyl transferase [Myriangium duriaei CBS 260.36]